MHWKLFALTWALIFLAAGYDACFAWRYRAVMREWELNPLARWGVEEIGLPAVLAAKFAGLAFAAGVAAYCRMRRSALERTLTLTTALVYALLLLHYAGHAPWPDTPAPAPRS